MFLQLHDGISGLDDTAAAGRAQYFLKILTSMPEDTTNMKLLTPAATAALLRQRTHAKKDKRVSALYTFADELNVTAIEGIVRYLSAYFENILCSCTGYSTRTHSFWVCDRWLETSLQDASSRSTVRSSDIAVSLDRLVRQVDTYIELVLSTNLERGALTKESAFKLLAEVLRYIFVCFIFGGTIVRTQARALVPKLFNWMIIIEKAENKSIALMCRRLLGKCIGLMCVDVNQTVDTDASNNMTNDIPTSINFEVETYKHLHLKAKEGNAGAIYGLGALTVVRMTVGKRDGNEIVTDMSSLDICQETLTVAKEGLSRVVASLRDSNGSTDKADYQALAIASCDVTSSLGSRGIIFGSNQTLDSKASDGHYMNLVKDVGEKLINMCKMKSCTSSLKCMAIRCLGNICSPLEVWGRNPNGYYDTCSDDQKRTNNNAFISISFRFNYFI